MKNLTYFGYLVLFTAFCGGLWCLQSKSCCTDYTINTVRPWTIVAGLNHQYIVETQSNFPGANATNEAVGIVLDDISNIWDNCNGGGSQFDEYIAKIFELEQSILATLMADESDTELVAEIEHVAYKFAIFLSRSNRFIDENKAEKLVLSWVNTDVRGIRLLVSGEYSLSVRSFESSMRRVSDLAAYIAAANCKEGCQYRIDFFSNGELGRTSRIRA